MYVLNLLFNKLSKNVFENFKNKDKKNKDKKYNCIRNNFFYEFNTSNLFIFLIFELNISNILYLLFKDSIFFLAYNIFFKKIKKKLCYKKK